MGVDVLRVCEVFLCVFRMSEYYTAVALYILGVGGDARGSGSGRRGVVVEVLIRL